MTFKQKIIKYLIEHNDQLSQAMNKTVLGESFENKEMFSACRAAAAEGIVLLKNDGMLPLRVDEETAFFGRVQNDYFYVGYGSGGDVNAPYRVSPMEAIRSKSVKFNEKLADTYKSWCEANVPFEGMWGMWPTCFDEMPLTGEQIEEAAKTSCTAVVFIGRAMGESMDNKAKKGYFYLADTEKKLIDQVTAVFAKTVIVIDAGNIIDLSWSRQYGNRIGAILYAFQGGMESGNAVADVLYGDVNPSGKLTDTIALSYGDYPSSKNFGKISYNFYREDIYVGYRYFETFAKDRVLYPFGFGMSYTSFAVKSAYAHDNGMCTIESKVTNTGRYTGAEVVQVYVNPPQGKLGKPLRNLVAFQKTKLLAPNETETIRFTVNPADFASYDDSGVTGHPYCFVLEEGSYGLYVGTDVRSAVPVGKWEAAELTVTKKLTSQAGNVSKLS